MLHVSCCTVVLLLVLLGIQWPALRGPLRKKFWQKKKRRPQPYWGGGGENSGNALEAWDALKYRAWGIPAVLSRGFPGSGKKNEPKPKLLSPDIFRWGGGLPREGVGAKKFGMSLETQGIKLFWRDIPGFCRDIPEAPEKFEKKMFGFNSRRLQETLWERFRGLSGIFPEVLPGSPSRTGGMAHINSTHARPLIALVS